MATTNIVDKDGNSISASDATVPSDRHFRGAWSLSGKTISEDLAVAKTIFKDKVREARTPLLAAEDVVYMKALEAGDSSAQAASVAKKKALRDAPPARASLLFSCVCIPIPFVPLAAVAPYSTIPLLI